MTYPLLERIQAPGDVKLLAENDLPQLCEEIRQFLIQSVSSTGGHLSSNLGVVELTVALHRTLDLPQDKILFDVGHQCYTHKLLTGRREGFAALRQKDGISGFPNPKESNCDTFVAGHGSAALSTAIGIARAKKIKNDDRLYFCAMDITAVRNAYGRQLGSFYTEAEFRGIGTVPMTFIRAPYVESVQGEAEVLAAVDGRIVAAREKNMLVTAFHPELNDDVSVHRYFLEMVRGA